ncbi:MAG: hypothetical protein QW156_03760 [Candidatus Aenigmatarchaeota archaeon]
MVKVIEVQTNERSVAMSLRLNGWDVLPTANGAFICWKKYSKNSLKAVQLMYGEDVKFRLISP